jgi:hypothetical protein
MVVVAMVLGVPLLVVIVVWRIARSQHIRMLTNEATQPNLAASRELERTVIGFRADDIESNIGRAALQGAAITTLAVPVHAAWELSQIDSDVVNAISAASSQASGSAAVAADHAGFLGFVQDHLGQIDQAGFISRLQGYVGEQRVFAILRDQGHLVEAARLPNNATWDALVDGQAVNVKS